MRFKKGGKVEVLKSEEVPYGLWIPAEIITGNGHYYSVRYDQGSHDECGSIVGRVPRKLIRPPPPPVDLSRSWVPGDVVEMFDRGTWRPVKVSKVAGNCCFLVRLPGCLKTFEVHGSDLRARQIWQDDQWRVVGKELVAEPDQNFVQLGSDYYKTPKEDAYHSRKRKLNLSSCGVKRVSTIGNLPIPAERHATKMKIALGNDGMQWRRTEDDFPPLPEKVVANAISYPKKKMGGNCMFTTRANRSKYSKMELDKRGSSAGFGCFPRRSLETDNVECDTYSPCSSSGSNSINLYGYPLAGPRVELDDNSDDAHSCADATSERQMLTPALGDVAEEVHKIERHAYRSTLEALYASGPMSWEQEALLTNLRQMLHISNDEHLFELRHLTSRESTALCY